MSFKTAVEDQIYHNAHNPLLPLKHHMPDVEAHVMSDGKLYLYGITMALLNSFKGPPRDQGIRLFWENICMGIRHVAVTADAISIMMSRVEKNS